MADCPHKWTVRYSVNSRQREQSFLTLAEAQTFQLTLTAGQRVQGAMFTDPRAGMTRFLPLAEMFIGQMARASAASTATYRSNFANPAVQDLLRDPDGGRRGEDERRGQDLAERDAGRLQR